MGNYGYRFTVPEMMGRISDNSLAQFELARQHQAVMLGSFNQRPLGSIKSECRCGLLRFARWRHVLALRKLRRHPRD